MKISNVFQDKEAKASQGLMLKRILASCMLLFLFSTLTYKFFLRQYAVWLSPESKDYTADIAIVVDGNSPRIRGGVKLLKSGNVDAIYMNVMPEKRLEELIKEHQLDRESVYWGGCNLPTTFHQALAFKATIERENLWPESVILVSHSYHLRRSLWTYKKVLEELSQDIDIKTHAINETKFREKLDWWQYEYAKNWVSTETQKNIFYRYYYGIMRNRVPKDITYVDFFNRQETSYSPDFYDNLCGKDDAEPH